MDKNQILIADLLSAAIRNEKIENFKNNNYEWDQVYEEAKAHGIHALLFPVLKDINDNNIINEELMQKWHKNTLSLGMWQLQLMKEVQNIFLLFHEQGIRAIALKGIVLRELYPYPELRSMGDADILVRPEDVSRAIDILSTAGFMEGDSNPEHIEFRNKNNIEIELHWSLIGEGRFRNIVRLEDMVWNTAVEAAVFEAPVLVLPREEHLLYLGLHMAKHIINAGFGLRQVSDFVLLYEAIKLEVDWAAFFDSLEKYGVERFFIILFLACEKLFSIKLPDYEEFYNKKNDKYVRLLIKEIFDGGLYGYKNSSRNMGSFILRKVKQDKSNRIINKLQYFRLLLFPGANQLGEKYHYAKMYPFLLPAAWIHRFAVNVFRKDFSLSEKMHFPKEYNKRSELLGWLNIR